MRLRPRQNVLSKLANLFAEFCQTIQRLSLNRRSPQRRNWFLNAGNHFNLLLLEDPFQAGAWQFADAEHDGGGTQFSANALDCFVGRIRNKGMNLHSMK